MAKKTNAQAQAQAQTQTQTQSVQVEGKEATMTKTVFKTSDEFTRALIATLPFEWECDNGPSACKGQPTFFTGYLLMGNKCAVLGAVAPEGVYPELSTKDLLPYVNYWELREWSLPTPEDEDEEE